MISRIRQRWAQSAPDRFVTLQPLPSFLTRALDSASPNPCPVSTGPPSDPVAPVSHQVAPLQVTVHSAWPSPSGHGLRVPFPALPLPSVPAPACRWRDGSYAPKYRPPKALQCGPYAPVLGPSRPPYRPPLLLDDPVSCGPALVLICSAWPAGSLSGRLSFGRPAATLAIASGPAPAFLSLESPHSVSDSMATLTDKAKLLGGNHIATGFCKHFVSGSLRHARSFATLCCVSLRPRCSATCLTGLHGAPLAVSPCQQARPRYRPFACPVLDGTCCGSPVPSGPPAAVNRPCICHCHGSDREAGEPAAAPVLCHLAGAPRPPLRPRFLLIAVWASLR